MRQARISALSTTTGMYDCAHPWPEDCFVQSGDRGLVLATQSYTTAFFEAFPISPECFLRGEGLTIAEAEQKCWDWYQQICNCKLDHADPANFDKRGYKNGLGVCKNCKVRLKIFEPSEICCKCGVACYYSRDNTGQWWCEACSPSMPRELWDETKILFERLKSEREAKQE